MTEFIKSFKNLDIISKSITYLMLTYYVTTSAGGIFIDLYIYKFFGDVSGLIVYNLLYYLFCFAGFALIGMGLSGLKYGFKWSFAIGITLFILSICVLLIFGHMQGNMLVLYVFSLLSGLGNGMFWCGVHTYELGYIEKERRDFYSSLLQIGRGTITIIFPLALSVIFFLGDTVMRFNGYNILFVMLIVVFMSSFYFINKLPMYSPRRVRIPDVMHKFKLREIYQNLFFISDSITELAPLLMTIIVIFLLKTEVNVGVFTGVVGILSIMITGLLSTKRNEKNRWRFMLIFALLFLVSYTLFGLYITIMGLIVFQLVFLVLEPGYRISAKVFIMKYMGDLQKDHDMFLSKVIYRELVIAIGRIVVLTLLFFLVTRPTLDVLSVIRYGLVVVGLAYVLSCLFVYLEERRG